jgi:hypothetical protein
MTPRPDSVPPRRSDAALSDIVVRGAREHNLQDITLSCRGRA